MNKTPRLPPSHTPSIGGGKLLFAKDPKLQTKKFG
jgi:hypothetical protein